MSILKTNGKKGSALGSLVAELKTVMNETGAAYANTTNTKHVIGLESLNESDASAIQTVADELSGTISNVITSVSDASDSLGVESISPQQLEAGVMTALAAGDPSAYALAATGNVAQGDSNTKLVGVSGNGVFGALDFRDAPSLEAFDNTELSKMIPQSIAFNVRASRQDEFTETFYPTVVVSPENGGVDVTIDFVSVFNTVKRSTRGATTDFDQKNLLDAVTDASILADESTALVPFLQPDGSNADVFVADTLVAPSIREVAGENVTTAPIAIGKEVDLIGISNHPGLITSGVLDSTDAIDPRLAIENVYLVNEWDNAGVPAFDVLKFNTIRLPRSGFVASHEGSGRELTLNFRSDSILLDVTTLNVDGSVPATLADVIAGNLSVRLAVNVTGNAHVEFGTVQTIAAPVTVIDIIDIDGNAIAKDAGVGLAIVTALAGLQVVGVDYLAARTNSNRRTRGLMLNNNSVTERFAIPLGSPISIPVPTGSANESSDLDSLINAARIRNVNNGVTTLLNYSDSLRSYVSNVRKGNKSGAIEGIARNVVNPFYEEITLDLTSALNSIRTKDRADDISSALINAIRDLSYRMYRDTAYQAALDASSFGSKTPRLLVGTDTVIQRHLMVEGDSRTFGISFADAKIVSTLDSRMANKIIVTFTRDGSEGTADPLAFGSHAWIPELVSTMPITRDGATYQEPMVQPRNRHINHLPAMAVINVVGLEAAMVSKISV